MTIDILWDIEGGSRSPVQNVGLGVLLLKSGSIDCDNNYPASGYDLSLISGMFNQCKGVGFFPKNGYIPEYNPATNKMVIKTPVPAINGHTHATPISFGVQEETISVITQRIYHGDVTGGPFELEIVRGGTSNTSARVVAVGDGYLDISHIGLDAVYYLTVELITKYNAHCADAISHLAADTENDGVSLPTELSWEACYVALNALKAAYNIHDAESGTYHPAAGTAHQITANDATTPASASTLANELRLDFIAHIEEDSGCYTLLNELITDYIAHCALTDGSVHNSADVENNNPTPIASHAIADLIVSANSLKAKYNLHDAESGVCHDDVGTAHQVSAENATDLASLITLVNAIKTEYEAHRAATDIHTVADETNVITTTDAASAAHVQADSGNVISLGATGVTLQADEVLTGEDSNASATSTTTVFDVWKMEFDPSIVQTILDHNNAPLVIDTPSVTLATGHARVNLVTNEIETLLSDGKTSLKVTYLKDEPDATTGIGGDIDAQPAAEVAAGTDLSALTGILFLAWGT
jgi:hypothetical protein